MSGEGGAPPASVPAPAPSAAGGGSDAGSAHGAAPARRKPSPVDVFLGVVNGVLSVGYPIAIWLGLTRLGTRGVGLVALALLVPMLAIRLRRADRATFWAVIRLPLIVLCLVTLGIVTDDPTFLLAMPVLISAALLVAFGGSLRPGAVPMIERFARTVEPELSPAKAAHCRQFTWIWCGFFVVNGAIAGALALLSSHFVWAAYTGGVAYALMGVLFAAEWVTRRLRFGPA